MKTEKDQQVLDLLKAGKSYTQIQIELSVSPSKISFVKQKYMTGLSSTPAATATTPTTTTISEAEKIVVSEFERELLALEEELNNFDAKKEAENTWNIIEKNHPEIYSDAVKKNMTLGQVLTLMGTKGINLFRG